MDVLNIFIGNLARTILNPLIVLMFVVATLYFIYGVVIYIKNSQSDTEREKGARHIMWGLIGIFIMMTVYGILEFVANSLNLMP